MHLARVTIRDIARESGVSVGTVSKYLSGRTDLREKNRIAIRSAIEGLDYRVNMVARCLAQKPIKLGVLLPSTFDGYFDPMLEGMRSVAESLADHKLTAVYERYRGYDDEEKVTQTLGRFIEEGVNGIILAPSRLGGLRDVVQQLEDRRIPILFVVSDSTEVRRLACIGVDAELSGRIAADLAGFALREGGTAATFIGNRDIVEHRVKSDSFAAGCGERGLRVLPPFETQDDSALAYRLAKCALGDHRDLKLIYVATGNSVAVCRAIGDCGKRGDVHVIATDARRELRPYVESGIVIGILDQHLHDQGRLAVNILYRYLAESVLEREDIALPPTLLLKSAILKKWAE